jgi:hypothetical protein
LLKYNCNSHINLLKFLYDHSSWVQKLNNLSAIVGRRAWVIQTNRRDVGILMGLDILAQVGTEQSTEHKAWHLLSAITSGKFHESYILFMNILKLSNFSTNSEKPFHAILNTDKLEMHQTQFYTPRNEMSVGRGPQRSAATATLLENYINQMLSQISVNFLFPNIS